MWLLGMVLILVCGMGLTVMRYWSYRPTYEAHASFTVRVANPLYASVSSYNEKTAEVMADTFPSILTSNLLQKRVMEQAEWKILPLSVEKISNEIQENSER